VPVFFDEAGMVEWETNMGPDVAVQMWQSRYGDTEVAVQVRRTDGTGRGGTGLERWSY